MKLSNRRHFIMAARENQLHLNELATNGGRPYIEARLWRAPNETDVSWFGDPSRGIAGRLERTSIVNNAGRIANKINQYIFRKPASRVGGDERFLADCTGDGESVNGFMQRVNTSLTYGRWCWIQADRAPLADYETLADRAPTRWILWDAFDVPDWSFDDAGELRWLITRSMVYVNDDPNVTATHGMLYTLYHREGGKVYVTEECDANLTMGGLRTHEEIPGLKRIPFVCVGKPSVKAWWFDDVENIQAQVMNLDSMHNETLTETVYPQLVLPNSLANSLEMRLRDDKINGDSIVSMVRELTIGRKIPILEAAEDKGISRYIAPSGDLSLLTTEADRKRASLFDMAGLALFNRETRKWQTAESKQFDQLDTNATLGNRAMLLKEAEEKAIALAVMFDPSFAAWEPVYATDFDVVDVASLSQALAQIANMPEKTPLVRKLEAKAALRVLREIASSIASEDEFAQAMAEIDATDYDVIDALPDPMEGMPDDADDDADGADDE